MSLLDHAIWWHVYPLGAVGAPAQADAQAVVPRLARLEAWLDYVIELGCSGVLLGPIFDSASHGYDTLDHFRLDPRLGDEATFDQLIAECHRRGLSVMLDGVFNHVGAGHRLVAEALAGTSALVKTEDGRPVAWEGHGDLAELDHANPAVADLVTEIMLHWLRRGIAGWRLDVAYAVPTTFWAQVIDRVRAEFPDALFLGEVIHGDYAGIVRDGHLDTVTQYELWKAIWSSISDRNLWELAWAVERHADFTASFLPQTFVGNHDVNRIADQVGPAGAALAVVVLATLPGMPSIYYGDEQGFTGRKGEGFAADLPLRPALPESPGELAAEGWWLYRLHQDVIGLRRRHAWLTRGTVEVLAKTNTELSYQVSGEGHVAAVRLWLEPQPHAQIEIDGEVAFSWPR